MIARTFNNSKLRPSLQWLRSPWAIAISAGLGIYVGTAHPRLATLMAPIGELYLGLLKMCVFPILLSAITASIGRLMGSPDAQRYGKRILLVFPLGLLSTSAIAALIAAIAGPGRNLSQENLSNLGVLVNQSGIDLEISLSGSTAVEASASGVSQFLVDIVPDNIFAALSEGQTLKVLCFSIIVGLSLGLLKESFTETIFSILDSIYKSFNQLIDWLTLILPFGLFSLLAYQFSQQGLEIISSMLTFVIVGFSTFIILYIISTIIIWKQTDFSFLKVIGMLRETSILALATSSSLACLPSAISTLSDSLKFNRQTIKLVTPLAITLCRFGSVSYFATGALFVAQLYDKPLDFNAFIIVILGSILAGMATSGVTGILTLTMLGIVLEPLNLPLEAVLVLFIAIDPLMDPFRTLGIVHTGMAATAVVSKEAHRSSSRSVSAQAMP